MVRLTTKNAGIAKSAVLQIRHQKRAFDLVSVTIRTISSRSSPHHPGADRSNEAAVDRRPSAWRDREALAIRVLVRAREDFAGGFSFPRLLSTRCLLLVFNNVFLLLFCRTRHALASLLPDARSSKLLSLSTARVGCAVSRPADEKPYPQMTQITQMEDGFDLRSICVTCGSSSVLASRCPPGLRCYLSLRSSRANKSAAFFRPRFGMTILVELNGIEPMTS